MIKSNQSIIQILKLTRSTWSNQSIIQILKLTKSVPNSIFGACDSQELKLLTRLRVGLSHLRYHKFRHGFNDTIDPFCPCTIEIESVSHFFLRCHNFDLQRLSLMNELFSINPNILELDDSSLSDLLLYGNKSYSNEVNTKIINASISFIKETSRTTYLNDFLICMSVFFFHE